MLMLSSVMPLCIVPDDISQHRSNVQDARKQRTIEFVKRKSFASKFKCEEMVFKLTMDRSTSVRHVLVGNKYILEIYDLMFQCHISWNASVSKSVFAFAVVRWRVWHITAMTSPFYFMENVEVFAWRFTLVRKFQVNLNNFCRHTMNAKLFVAVVTVMISDEIWFMTQQKRYEVIFI